MNHTTIDFVFRLEIPNTIRSPFLVFFARFLAYKAVFGD